MSEDTEQLKKEKEEKIKCPCCGEFTLSKPLNPRADLVDQWLSCMITSTPFHHTYAVYGGKMKVTVTQLSADEIDEAESMVNLLHFIKDIDWSKTENGGICPVSIDQMISSVNLNTCIVSITIEADNRTRTFKPSAAVKAAYSVIKDKEAGIRGGLPVDDWITELKECEKLLLSSDNVSAVPQVMLMSIAEAHNRLSHILLDTGFDESFWEGIELA